MTIPFTQPLVPGYVRVSVADHDGARVEGTFEVIEAAPPPPDQDLAQADLPGSLRTLLAADGWAKRSPTQWSLYTYQFVAPLADSFDPARLLRDCLETVDTCHDR